MRAREAFAGLREQGVRELRLHQRRPRRHARRRRTARRSSWVARAAADGQLIYSGGIGTLDDLRAPRGLRAELALEKLTGVIVGKALYEGSFTIAQETPPAGAAPAADEPGCDRGYG